MICAELGKCQPTDRVMFDRYSILHPEGRELIAGWFDRAWNARYSTGEDCFETFIFAWFAVNGWAACVTQLDSDRQYIEALMCSESMCNEFARLVDAKTALSEHANQFKAMWPIFEVKELRRLNVLRHHKGERGSVVQNYLDANAVHYEPKCWGRHTANKEQIPLDWPHTLKAIYRVRCNLFYGEKAAHSEMDQQVVRSAFLTLVHFFELAGYLKSTP